MAERHDLVIGIGNPLRGDDGVGWWLAERAARLSPASRNRPALQVQSVQQLTPELAERLALARRVLFVDAWLAPAGLRAQPGASIAEPPVAPIVPRLQPLQPTRQVNGEPAMADISVFSHRLDPAQLLAITALLHGREPQAALLLVPLFATSHGEDFSMPLRRLLPQAEALLRRWCAGGIPAAGCVAGSRSRDSESHA